MLQHVLTSSVVTLRPFALSLYSWRIMLLVGGEGFEPPMSYDFIDTFSDASSIPENYSHIEACATIAFDHSAILPFPSRQAASQPTHQHQHQRCHDAIHHTLPAGKFLALDVINNVVHNLIVLLVLHVSEFSLLDHSLDVVQWVSPSCHPSLS